MRLTACTFVVLYCCCLPSVISAQSIYRPGLQAKPAVGEPAEAAQGDPIYRETRYTERLHSAARVKEPVVVDKDFTIRPDYILKAEQDKNTLRFCIEDSSKRSLGVLSPRKICLYSTKDTEWFDMLFTQTNGSILSHRKKLKNSVAFEPFDDSDGVIKGAFRREIIFSGAAGGVLRLLYREFLDDLARPAFSQELSYDLPSGAPLTLNVKSARIEVTRAGNDGIVYRVLKGFAGET